MTNRTSGLHRVATLAGTVGVVLSLAGCGRTLVFAERDGVNLAVRANPSATPPLGVNFGLERVIATIVPPAGQKDGKPSGEAVSMFAGFQVDATNVNLKNTLNVDLTINTQFASGAAAERVAGNPEAVAKIVSMRSTTFATSDSAKQFRAWLMPDGVLSNTRNTKLQEWLKNRYPTKEVFPGDLLGDYSDEYEQAREAALRDLKNVPARP